MNQQSPPSDDHASLTPSASTNFVQQSSQRRPALPAASLTASPDRNAAARSAALALPLGLAGPVSAGQSLPERQGHACGRRRPFPRSTCRTPRPTSVATLPWRFADSVRLSASQFGQADAARRPWPADPLLLRPSLSQSL